MFVLGLVCARGGSKGVPRKAIKLLNGKPLIYYAIKQLKESPSVNEVIISTDDREIADVAKRYGAKVPFMRPAELATDSAGKFGAMQHAVKEYEKVTGQKVDILVDRDPTNPSISSDDIEGCIRLLKKNRDIDTTTTAHESHFNPYFNMMEVNEKGFMQVSKKPKKEILRRQDAPKVYQLNSGVICMWRDSVLKGKTVYTDKVKLYEVPTERGIMIDTTVDFEFVGFLMKKGIIDPMEE